MSKSKFMLYGRYLKVLTLAIYRMHMEVLRQTNTRERLSESSLHEKHSHEFSDWFRDYVSIMSHLRHMVNILFSFSFFFFFW
jgi:hypothetical protein